MSLKDEVKEELENNLYDDIFDEDQINNALSMLDYYDDDLTDITDNDLDILFSCIKDALLESKLNLL